MQNMPLRTTQEAQYGFESTGSLHLRVAGFEHRRDAERFLEALKARFRRFDLELHPGKTRLIEFGRFAMANRRRRGQGKPETFDFLGFTHYCAKDRNGRFQLGRKPAAKRVTRTLKRIAEVLRRRRHRPKTETARWLGRVLDGWLNYYAVPTSFRWLARFVRRLVRLWLRELRRRSQKDRHSWDSLQGLVDTHWPASASDHPPRGTPRQCAGRELPGRRRADALLITVGVCETTRSWVFELSAQATRNPTHKISN